MFHAGGFVLGSTAMIPKRHIDYLVATGFVVIAPEYRLCPQVSLYEGPIQDAKDVYRWCQEKLPTELEQHAAGVAVDVSRIGVMGQSAGGLLALTTGLCANPPRAIVDFYGSKYLSDPSWSQKLPVFAHIPDQAEEHVAKIYNGRQAITSGPMFVDGKPLLSDPRCAWFIQQVKNGTSISSIVPDGDLERVDATAHFGKGFPPTYFLHGEPDIFVDYKLSIRAHRELEALGVETVMAADEVGHGFDLQEQGDAELLFSNHVAPALDWLQQHV